MVIINYTVQDFFGSTLAFFLFPLIFVFPGYVCAHVFDLFNFKERLLPGRMAISVLISMAISPILFFLAYRFGSSFFAFSLMAIFFTGFISLIWLKRKTILLPWGVNSRTITIALWILGGWSIFAIISLVDIQWGNRLYYTTIAFDMTSRVSIITAITRTGVPPINPGYFPGHSVPLTFLYYFWYILCSLIDQIGGRWVDARMAMIASVAWCGLGLICLIAVYLRLRNNLSKPEKSWKNAFLGIAALTISGLDIYPALLLMVKSRLSIGSIWPGGDIEHWNEQITAWLGAISWVPHHVASLIACVTGFLLIQSVRGQSAKRQIAGAVIAGLAFASACGLSIYVTFVFVLFWAAWLIFLLFDKKEYRTIIILTLTGLFALLAIFPFLRDLLHGGTSMATGSFPLAFQVRGFKLLLPFLLSFPEAVKNLVYLAFLPINYFFELGFYFFAGFLWLHKYGKTARKANPFYMPEILLLGASVFVGTFIRSTLIMHNDLGWRSWMFGQFILLIWALDIGQEFLLQNSLTTYFTSKSRTETIKYGKIFAQLMVIGMLTSLFSVSMLRFWPMLIDTGITGIPVDLSPDTQLGKRTFAARQAYEYIRDNLPDDLIVQYNPIVLLDRPSGLYGTRQMVVSDHSAYGVPLDVFQPMQAEAGSIFLNNENGWPQIDPICKQLSIDLIILNDLDPVWRNLPVLIQQRHPILNNLYYAIFPCGVFTNP